MCTASTNQVDDILKTLFDCKKEPKFFKAWHLSSFFVWKRAKWVETETDREKEAQMNEQNFNFSLKTTTLIFFEFSINFKDQLINFFDLFWDENLN